MRTRRSMAPRSRMASERFQSASGTRAATRVAPRLRHSAISPAPWPLTPAWERTPSAPPAQAPAAAPAAVAASHPVASAGPIPGIATKPPANPASPPTTAPISAPFVGRAGTLPHPRLQLDCPSVDDECAIAAMMDRLGSFLGRIRPRLEHFENEDVEFLHQTRIDDPALEIGEALGNERRCNTNGRQLSEAKRAEFVDVASG